MTEQPEQAKPAERRSKAVKSLAQMISLDKAVMAALLLLATLVIAVLWMGDRIGVQLLSITPSEAVHSTSSIQLEFSEAMNQASVLEHFSIEPAVEGTFSWNGATLSFRPQTPFQPGASYTLHLRAGALSENGRELLEDYNHPFTVAYPRIAYLYPAAEYYQNIWVFDPRDFSSKRPVTNSSLGIYDFAASPDGSRIAYSEFGLNAHTATIQLLDLATGSIQDLTNCAEQFSACIHPVWRPDGQMLAYERIDDNSDLGLSGGGSRRVWLLDLTSNPPGTRPLFADSQLIAYQPQWSADGNLLGVYSPVSSEILLYDFRDKSTTAIPSDTSASFLISPDGAQLAFFDWVVQDDATVQANLLIRDLETGLDFPIPGDETAPHNRFAAWRPDGAMLALIRSQTVVSRDSQVYLLDLRDKSSQALTSDPHYATSALLWDPTGTQLLLERSQVIDNDGQPIAQRQPEIWLYDLNTQELSQLVANGYAPQWLP